MGGALFPESAADFTFIYPPAVFEIIGCSAG
jgi:hypothetical protein